MARIRTVKPEFFKHHDLYKAEKESELPLRLGFQGLWLCADKEGRFKWRPTSLKLDILPFDDLDFEDVLIELAIAGFIVKYEVVGKHYGYIPSFRDHQRITGSEAQGESKIPDPKIGNTLETTRKHLGNNKETKTEIITDCISIGNNKETPWKQQGNTLDDWKGKEGKGKEGKGGEGKFPQAQDFNGLPEINIGGAKQLISITQKVTVSTADINGMWEVFKVQNLTGKKYYENNEDVYSHFLHWLKTQKFTKTTEGVKLSFK